ncbi:MAG TPA: hypothetical protein VLJ58_15250 [Ramlibacter sp.]|nr:hypothetical protein [Ramlibacter sp.]
MPAPRARRSDLIDELQYQPRLRPSLQLGAAPADEGAPAERVRAGLTWRALQAQPEEQINDRVELERLDRAMVVARKQLYTARGEAAALRAEVDRSAQERFPGPVFWAVGAVAVLGVGGWVLERRRLLALQERIERERELQARHLVEAAFMPTAELPGHSEFERSDLNVMGDEADQWIAQSGVAMPAPR